MVSQESSKKETDPGPGDLIEIIHMGYQHWAIYVGDGYVIHVTSPDDLYALAGAKKAVVKKERLVDVVGSNCWQVNNKYDSKYEPLPISKIISRAEAMVGQEVEYNLISRNCEHFVTELRYGVARSDQVREKARKVVIVGGLAVVVLCAIVSPWHIPSLGAAVVKQYLSRAHSHLSRCSS